MRPVLLVDLEKYFEGNEHMIPDPFRVVLKAAVSWSAYRDQNYSPLVASTQVIIINQDQTPLLRYSTLFPTTTLCHWMTILLRHGQRSWQAHLAMATWTYESRRVRQERGD